MASHIGTATEGRFHLTAFHHHNHRHSLASGYSVVHDVLHESLMTPSSLIFTHAMLQIKHRIFFLSLFIFSRCVHHSAAPLLGRGSIILERAHLTLGPSLSRTVIITFVALRYLDASCLFVAAEECITCWVNHLNAVHDEEVIEEANYQWCSLSHPSTFFIALHIKFLSADIHLYCLCSRCIEHEVGSVCSIHFRKFVARFSCRGSVSISWYLLCGIYGISHGLEHL